jgi:hypothetical protein
MGGRKCRGVEMIQSLNVSGKTRDPPLQVWVFHRSEFSYLYPWKNPWETCGLPLPLQYTIWSYDHLGISQFVLVQF